MKRLISVVLCLLIVLSLTLPAFAIKIVKVTGIKLDKTNVSLEIGDTNKLVVDFTPANTTQTLLTFSTSDKNVATIDSYGTIKAENVGRAVITVNSLSNKALVATATVTVKAKPQVTLSVTVFDRGNVGGTPADNNIYTNWIKTQFAKVEPNILLKFVTAPRWQEVNRLNVWMASNQAPDVCITYDVNSVFNYYKSGGLAQLDVALDTYGPQLKEFLGRDVISRGRYYGKLWAIPARRVMNARIATWIRQDWLDTLKLPLPTTREEYYNVLKEFKAKNPARVGKLVPLSLAQDVAWGADHLLESFLTDKSEHARIMSGGNLRFLGAGYKEGVRFLNKMYHEGLISAEFPLDKDGNMASTDFTRGYVGSTIGNYDMPLRSGTNHILEMKKRFPSFNLVPIDPFKDKDGITTKQVYDQAGLRIIVPKTSEKKVNEAIKYLNWMANRDVIFFLQYGEEGVNHVVKDGLPIYQVVTGDKIFNSVNNIDYTLIVNGIQAGDTEKNLKVNSLAYGGVEDLFIRAVKVSTANSYVPPVLSIPNEADAKYSNTLREKGFEVFAKTITASPSDFDNVWAQMINELMKAGGQEVLDARRSAWRIERKK